ncbi:MAG: IS4 family transposase [Akkermansiaceae bacterium]|jgi:hypothetical protein|nr:IS4 family transposase [Akkermansiaceae bacterium]
MHEIERILGLCKLPPSRKRNLPKPVMVFYVIALCLFPSVGYLEVQGWLFAGLTWLNGVPFGGCAKSAFSFARTKLGSEAMRMIHRELARPLADQRLRGSYWKGFHLVAIDGSTLALQDTKANAKAFGRPGNQKGKGAWPMVRFVALAEVGTHMVFEAALAGYRSSEITLAGKLVGCLRPGMLCLADRLFPGYWLWKKAAATGCALVWRAKVSLTLEPVRALSDGSWLARWYPNEKDRRKHKGEFQLVRVVEYKLRPRDGAGPQAGEESYRLITTILEPGAASAEDLAGLYPQRWEIELTFKEIKCVLRGGLITLRSKTPELVRQEFWALLLAHYAMRKMIAHAAADRDMDPDNISCKGAVEIIKMTLAGCPLLFPPRAEAGSVPDDV